MMSTSKPERIGGQDDQVLVNLLIDSNHRAHAKKFFNHIDRLYIQAFSQILDRNDFGNADALTFLTRRRYGGTAFTF